MAKKKSCFLYFVLLAAVILAAPVVYKYITSFKRHSALHDATRHGDIAEVRRLIEEGADVNSRDFRGQTPLLLAVGYRHLEIARLLLENGANVHAKDHEGTSALQLGIGNSGANSEMVALLQSFGAKD